MSRQHNEQCPSTVSKEATFLTAESEGATSQTRSREGLFPPLEEHSCTCRKLHLGCGPNVLEGWINTDIILSLNDIFYLDIRKPFPIGDSQIDYVFSEHVIEHLSLVEGMRMLDECCRILRPGGKIRIATPDLAQILLLYATQSTSAARYKSWAIAFNGFPSIAGIECVLINNFMRAWGHRFIYDRAALRYFLSRAGFDSVQQCLVGNSTDSNFHNIERHHVHIGKEPNEFETMVFEARRP
jgi:predicted SAM-dependent methyltransferase